MLSGNADAREQAGRDLVRYRDGLADEDRAVYDRAVKKLGHEPYSREDYIFICDEVGGGSLKRKFDEQLKNGEVDWGNLTDEQKYVVDKYYNAKLISSPNFHTAYPKSRTAKLTDLRTGKSFFIVLREEYRLDYHRDWGPLSRADLDIIQSIINEEKIPRNDGSLWNGRPGILTMVDDDGSSYNVGFHLYSHMGNTPGVMEGETNKTVQTGPKVGHFDLYFGDSSGGGAKTGKKLNDAAQESYDKTH